MGNHTPGDANHDASFMADWYDDEAPARFQVVVDGEPYDLALEWGVDFRGVYLADVAPPAVDCHEYYFSWEDAEGTEAVFPEEGSYTYGEACDNAVGWVSSQTSVDGGNGDNGGGNDGGGGMDGLDESGNPLTAGAPKLVGCSSSASASSLAALLLAGACLLPVAGRRRD
jgi:hypothetical protein